MTPPRKACVIGWPVAHSRSPMIHGYWLRTLGIDGSYEKVPVAPDALATFLADMRRLGYVGANVTIPHKAAAAEACDRLTETAARLGVVNTLWFEDGLLCGDTTDGEGFLAALDAEAPAWDRPGSDGTRDVAVVLGAGGAAGAIADALVARRCGRVVIANRTAEKAMGLAARLGCEAVPFADVPSLLSEASLLVNTTSAGMVGQGALDFDLSRLPAHAVVDDIVYVPALTPLLRAARARGLRTVGGLGMLLHQAVPGFARWFGTTPAVSPELRALVEADVAAASPKTDETSRP